MATQAQVKAFIDKIAPLAIAEYKKGKKILPSVCIAQACCESAYGTSPRMIAANAVFGIKVGKSKVHFGNAWNDKAYSTKTKECYDGKTYTEITDMFRAYESVANSVTDYYDMLMKCSRYARVIGETDTTKAVTAIKNGGYATSPTYITTITSIINSKSLTEYDKEAMKDTEKGENIMSLNGQDLAAFAGTKLGTPYVYGAKGANGKFSQSQLNSLKAAYPNMFTASYMAKIAAKALVGKVCNDCSGLPAWYTGKNIGSAQLYSTAYTRMPIANVKEFAPGVILWKNGHVGVYIGMENGVPMCIESKGIDYGCVKTKVSETAWEYGLTFSYMTYTYATNVSGTWKGTNPYTQPTTTVKNGMTGTGVKWLQWELVEAGYKITIDGDFGNKTMEALKAFQQSCKITVDGLCGPTTRKYLLAN